MTTNTIPATRVVTRNKYRVERPEYTSPEAFRAALQRAKELGERLQAQYAVSGRKAQAGERA